MHRQHWTAVTAVAVVAAIAVGSGCDCGDQARSLMYGDDDGPVTPTEERGEEESRHWEVEPNDRPEDATPIEVTSEMEPVYATIDPADDVDWFSLKLDDEESWMVELIVEPRDPELDLELYLEVPGDEDRAPLVYNLASEGEAESIPRLKLPPKEARRFFVTGDGESTGEYRVLVRRQLSAAAVAMAPNDYPHLATTLEVPGEIQGFYDRPGDRDIFYVPAESLQAGVYSLEISAIDGISQLLKIYDDDSLETPLMRIPVSDSRPAVIPNLSLDAERGEGLYFVLSADESYDREQTYRLRLIEHPQGEDYVLEREPNDTEGTAQRVDFDTPIRGYLHTPDDVDRFRIAIEEEETGREEEEEEKQEEDSEFSDAVLRLIEDKELDRDELPEIVDPWASVVEKDAPEHVVQVRLMPLSDGHRLAMTWIPEEGEKREFRADDPEEGLVLCNETLTEGEFDIEISSVSTKEGFRPRSFDYELEMINVAKEEGIEIEPNDELKKADRLPVGESRIGYIAREGDVDYYAFVVGPDEPYVVDDSADDDEAADDDDNGESVDPWEAPETETVEIYLEGNRLDLGFEVYDDEGGRVANVNQRGPGADEEMEIDLPQGLYYVAVSATSGAVCEPYQIEIRER